MVASEADLLAEMQQQQQLIEALLSTQQMLMRQRESLDEEMAAKMERLWSDVSLSPQSSMSESESIGKKKKRREVEEIELNDEEVVYRSMDGGGEADAELADDGEPITYRSLSIGSDDIGADLPSLSEMRVSSSAAAAAAAAAGGEFLEDEAVWFLTRRVEILAELKSHLEKAGDLTDPAAADMMAHALELSGQFRQLEV